MPHEPPQQPVNLSLSVDEAEVLIETLLWAINKTRDQEAKAARKAIFYKLALAAAERDLERS